MYTYMKMNDRSIVDERSDSRKCMELLSILLALMILCVMAKVQATSLPGREAAAEKRNVSEELDGEIAPISGISTENRLWKLPGITVENGLNQRLILPEIPAVVLKEDFSQRIGTEDALMPPVLIQTEPLAEPSEQPKAPADVVTVPEHTELPSEEIPEEEQIFSYGGFLCDASGRIIGCDSSISVTDGVLCLPSGKGCTGVAKGAFSSLGEQVDEIYIPANIIAIEEGAFDGLPEFLFIQVHPDNPVYESKEGYLYKKRI